MEKIIVLVISFVVVSIVSLSSEAQYNGPNYPVGPVIRDVTDDTSALNAAGDCLKQLKVVCTGNIYGGACVQVICGCDKVRTAAKKRGTPKAKKAAVAVEKGVEAVGNDRSGDIDALIDALKLEIEQRKAEDKRIEAKLDKHIEAECHDGERRCSDENTPAVCKDGAWVDEPDCDADEYCNDGLCMPKETPVVETSDWQASPVMALGAVLSRGPKAFLVSAGLRLESKLVVIDVTGGAGTTFEDDPHFAFGANLSAEGKLAPIFRLGGAVQYLHSDITDETQIAIGIGPKATIGAPESWKVRPELSLSGGIAGISQYVEVSRDADHAILEPEAKVGWFFGAMFNLNF